jgi:hypothetical protein
VNFSSLCAGRRRFLQVFAQRIFYLRKGIGRRKSKAGIPGNIPVAGFFFTSNCLK